MFITLPPELHFHIFSYLDAIDLFNLLQTCCKLNNVVDYFINAKTNLVAAIINYCKQKSLHIIVLNLETSKRFEIYLNKTLLYCHQKDSNVPIIFDVTESEIFLPHLSHCQVRYNPKYKVLTFKKTSPYQCFREEHVFDPQTRYPVKTKQFSVNLTSNGAFLWNIQFNCWKPKGYKLFYVKNFKSVDRDHKYYLIIPQSAKKLAILSDNSLRILKIVPITQTFLELTIISESRIYECLIDGIRELAHIKSISLLPFNLNLNRCLLINTILFHNNGYLTIIKDKSHTDEKVSINFEWC